MESTLGKKLQTEIRISEFRIQNLVYMDFVFPIYSIDSEGTKMELVKVLSLGKSRDPAMTNLIRSLRKRGHAYKTLVIGKQWDRWKRRLGRYIEELRHYDPEEIICCTNNDETLVIGSPESLYYRFRRYDKSLVFASQEYYKGAMVLNNWWNHQDKTVRPANEFLNSTMVVGSARNIKSCFEYAINSKFNTLESALSAYVEAFPQNVQLDSDRALFGIVTRANVVNFKTRIGAVMNLETLRTPCMIAIVDKEMDLMLRMNHFGRHVLEKAYVPTSLLDTIGRAVRKILDPNNRHLLAITRNVPFVFASFIRPLIEK